MQEEQLEQEEINEIKQTIKDLNAKIDDKIKELSESAGKTYEEKKEYAKEKISENPLAYLVGAFFGGVILGYAMRRGKS